MAAIAVQASRSGTRKLTWSSKYLVSVISFVLFLVLWQVVAQYVVHATYKLPSPVEILTGMWPLALSGELETDFLTSMMHYASGMLLAVAVGIPLGALTGWYRILDRALTPIIEIFRPIPPIAWIPFAIVWLHLTDAAAAAIIFVGAVFPIIVNTYTGFRSVSRTLVEAATLLGCRKQWQILRKVALPSALPYIASGVRIGMAVGWVSLVAAEMFGVSTTGLGYKIWNNYNVHAMDLVLGYMLLVGLISLAFDATFRLLVDRYLLRWRAGLVN
jgi:NitT/TauT family transport system permease protein